MEGGIKIRSSSSHCFKPIHPKLKLPRLYPLCLIRGVVVHHGFQTLMGAREKLRQLNRLNEKGLAIPSSRKASGAETPTSTATAKERRRDG